MHALFAPELFEKATQFRFSERLLQIGDKRRQDRLLPQHCRSKNVAEIALILGSAG